MQHHLIPFRDAGIREGYRNGENIEFLASRFGVRTNQVRTILRSCFPDERLTRRYMTPTRTAVPKAKKPRVSRKDHEKRERILAMYADGKTLQDIAEAEGCSHQRVHQILIDERVKCRGKGSGDHTAQKERAKARHAEVLQLYQSGVSRQDIAAQMGYTQAYMRQILAKAGVPDGRTIRRKSLEDGDMKLCTGCQKWQSKADCFSGRQSQCKSCIAANTRAWYHNRRYGGEEQA